MPAATVIPAPISFFELLRFKSSLFDFCLGQLVRPRVCTLQGLGFLLESVLCLAVWHRAPHFQFEEIGMFHAGACLWTQ